MFPALQRVAGCCEAMAETYRTRSGAAARKADYLQADLDADGYAFRYKKQGVTCAC